jgi:hypothetical protein
MRLAEGLVVRLAELLAACSWSGGRRGDAGGRRPAHPCRECRRQLEEEPKMEGERRSTVGATAQERSMGACRKKKGT